MVYVHLVVYFNQSFDSSINNTNDIENIESDNEVIDSDDEIIDSDRSRIFEQSENRLHVQQALLSCLL